MAVMGRSWSRRPSVERIDLWTRSPLYAVSALEPLALLMVLTEEVGARREDAAALLLAVAVAHTVTCVLVLRAAFHRRLGGPPPGTRLLGVAAGLTAAGLAVGPLALPAYGRLLGSDGFPVGLAVSVIFCGALTAAVTPMLTRAGLVVALAAPATVAGVLQLVLVGTTAQAPWPLTYLMIVGTLVLMYRSSAWVLGLVWEIDRARDVEARLAVAEERLRVARDLHDVLGRNLTLIAVNSELAAGLARRGSQEAEARMHGVRQLAETSMREVRDVVGGQRTADLDAELAGARAVLRAAGIGTRVIGDGSTLPAGVQSALGWAVREATTNILRHADPTRVTIELDLDSGAAPPTTRLRIENDGVRRSGPPAQLDGHGTGLAGLRERLGQLGGTLSADPLPGGRFRVDVRLVLPAREEQSR